nr:DNRLRE domain-containing protein [Pyxidicoccus fallax]
MLPALAFLVGCGDGVGLAEPGASSPPEVESAKAAAVTDACKPFTQEEHIGLTATYDTHVVQASAGSSFNSATTLVVDGSPRQDVYLRFVFGLQSENDTLIRARLRLYATDGSSNGPALYSTTGGWNGNTLTWNNRPAPIGSPLGNVGAVSSGSWVEYDVSSVVKKSGDHAFVLIPEAGDGVDFVSTEDSRYDLHPTLVVTRVHTACSYQGVGGELDAVWHKGGTGDEWAHAMATDSTGAWVLAGRYTGSGSLGGDVFSGPGGVMLGRFRPDGTHEWSRAYPQANANVTVTDVTLTPLGNVLMVGHYTGTPDFGTGPLPATSVYTPASFIAKFSPSGRITWAKGFTASKPDDGGTQRVPILARAVATDANGSLIVTGAFFGETHLGGGILDAGPNSRASEDAAPGLFLAKFSWEGNHLWSTALQAGYAPTEGRTLATDSAGNVLLGGLVSRPHPLATNAENPLIAKYSPTGTLLWTRVLQGAIGDISALAVLPGDAVAFAGNFRNSFTFGGQTLTSASTDPYDSNPDLMLGVLEASGADRRAFRHGTTGTEEMSRMVVDAQGNFMVMGSFFGTGDVGGGPLGAPVSEYHGFVASYSPTGAHRWSRYLDIPGKVLGMQPDGSTLAGYSFSGTTQVEQTRHGPAQGRDILLLRVAP